MSREPPRAFADHFSGHAEAYAAYRPTYPRALFAHLASIAPRRELAWDCATGSGQAARELAQDFRRVVATDASSAQLSHAEVPQNVTLAAAPAEASGLETGSVDLVTVAQAVHWFDLERFYAEVERVLVPGGLVAVWSYGLCVCTPAIDAVVQRLYHEVVGADWPPERRYIDEAYETLPFPFAPVAAPPFAMESTWRFEALVGYLRTWSAVQRFVAREGSDPIAQVRADLQAAWGEASLVRRVSWPLYLRLGARSPG